MMKKVAIVYWSGTGNTEAMAKAIECGVRKSGHAVNLFAVEQFGLADMKDFDGFIFGCPAMGDEVLEEGTFEPFFTEVEGHLSEVPVALFGSYGWGGGIWMKSWSERTRAAGARLFEDGLAVENGPGDEELMACEQLGLSFAHSL